MKEENALLLQNLYGTHPKTIIIYGIGVREYDSNFTNSNKKIWPIMKLVETQNQSEPTQSANSDIVVIGNKLTLETVSHQSVARNTEKIAFSKEKPTRVPILIRRTISSLDIYDIPEIPIIFVLGRYLIVNCLNK